VPSPELQDGPVTLVIDDADSPTDATLDAAGQQIYFTTGGAASALYLAKDGAGQEIAGGFDDLENVVISSDGKTAYVVGRKDGGESSIFSIPVEGGAVSVLVEGYEAQLIDLSVEGSQDMLTFSGFDPMSGNPGVFKVPASGGVPSVVVGDLPVDLPAGVAVGTQAIYLAAEGETGGEVYQIENGAASRIVQGIQLGTPGGIALTLDESTLLVSALAEDHSSEVVVVNLSDNSTTIFNDTISANQGSGGVHRASSMNRFAWAGYGSGGGRVYQIDL